MIIDLLLVVQGRSLMRRDIGERMGMMKMDGMGVGGRIFVGTDQTDSSVFVVDFDFKVKEMLSR